MFHLGRSGVGSSADQRRKFERALFGEFYRGHDLERPRYGSLNLMKKCTGVSKALRYGKSYMVLKDHVKRFCTMTSCDTSQFHAELGTLEHCAHVLLAMIKLCDISTEKKDKLLEGVSNKDKREKRLDQAKQDHTKHFLTQVYNLVNSGREADLDLTR